MTSSSIRSYKDLIVWQKSMELVRQVYTLTNSFPSHEIYGLSLQIRRSAVSIPSNIAEGFGRQSNKEYAHFLLIEFGSTLELETQLQIGYELKYMNVQKYETVINLLTEVAKMLNVMKRNERNYR